MCVDGFVPSPSSLSPSLLAALNAFAQFIDTDSPGMPYGNQLSYRYWGRMTHICVSKLTTIGSDNGLSHGRCKAIIWTKAGNIVEWGPGNEIQWTFNRNLNISFKIKQFKMASGKWRSFFFGLNVLRQLYDCYSASDTNMRNTGEYLTCIQEHLTQRAQDAIITSLWRQNDVVASFWRHDDVIFASCVRWVIYTTTHAQQNCVWDILYGI